MDTIVAATSNGAKVLRVYDKTGSLEAGKSADLLVINGNPLENIRAIDVENMEVIMKRRRVHQGLIAALSPKAYRGHSARGCAETVKTKVRRNNGE